MNANCNDRDRILLDGTPAEWTALEAHAATCAACAEELRAWKSLSTAAAELRNYDDNPALWPRVQQALVDNSAGPNRREKRWSWLAAWLGLGLSWQAAAVSAFALLLLVSGGWLYLGRVGKPPVSAGSAPFLKSKALNEVEHAQDAYVKAIDKLAAEAKPQLENPDSPLLANYREKLLVLDSAIDDLRVQAGQNPSNAHLRYELLAVYQEKQRTLEEILEAKQQ
jgi:anti-sigma factor RsiW